MPCMPDDKELDCFIYVETFKYCTVYVHRTLSKSDKREQISNHSSYLKTIDAEISIYHIKSVKSTKYIFLLKNISLIQQRPTKYVHCEICACVDLLVVRYHLIDVSRIHVLKKVSPYKMAVSF